MVETEARDPVVVEFRRRRAMTWARVKLSVTIAGAGFLLVGALILFPDRVPGRFHLGLFFGGFAATVLAIIHINLVAARNFRCPACDAAIIHDEGLILNPDACPKCGIRLK